MGRHDQQGRRRPGPLIHPVDEDAGDNQNKRGFRLISCLPSTLRERSLETQSDAPVGEQCEPVGGDGRPSEVLESVAVVGGDTDVGVERARCPPRTTKGSVGSKPIALARCSSAGTTRTQTTAFGTWRNRQLSNGRAPIETARRGRLARPPPTTTNPKDRLAGSTRSILVTAPRASTASAGCPSRTRGFLNSASGVARVVRRVAPEEPALRRRPGCDRGLASPAATGRPTCPAS